MHYLDNAANTWPKPLVVYQATDRAFALVQNRPEIAQCTREGDEGPSLAATQVELAGLLGIANPERIAFTQSCSQAIALALQTLSWQRNDGIVISAVEHQSVTEPVLRLAREKGIRFYIVPYSPENPFDLTECEALLQTHPEIRLVVTTHASNVIGCMLPVADIGRLARRYDSLYMVDAAQTAGLWPLDVERDHIDFLAMPGHKALYGPRGVGALYVGERVPVVPAALSSRHPNTSSPAVLALGESVRWLRGMGLQTLRQHSLELLANLQDALEEIPEVTVYGLTDISQQAPLLSFNVLNHHPEVLAARLYQDFGLVLKAGLHRSRLSHEAIGTIHRGGTLRASLGYHTRPEDTQALASAIKTILTGSRSAAWSWLPG